MDRESGRSACDTLQTRNLSSTFFYHLDNAAQSAARLTENMRGRLVGNDGIARHHSSEELNFLQLVHVNLHTLSAGRIAVAVGGLRSACEWKNDQAPTLPKMHNYPSSLPLFAESLLGGARITPLCPDRTVTSKVIRDHEKEAYDSTQRGASDAINEQQDPKWLLQNR